MAAWSKGYRGSADWTGFIPECLDPFDQCLPRQISTSPFGCKGKIVDGKDAMKSAGIKPLTLEAKEGVALINGTQLMTALGVLAVFDAMHLLRNATIASAMTARAI